MKLAFHVALTFITGGLWLVVLLVRHLIKN
jgi:hypothetical protein